MYWSIFDCEFTMVIALLGFLKEIFFKISNEKRESFNLINPFSKKKRNIHHVRNFHPRSVALCALARRVMQSNRASNKLQVNRATSSNHFRIADAVLLTD